MDRRHGAQAAVAHVQRRLVRIRRPQRLGRVAGVGNDPHRIAQIKGPRLAGNVGRREMVVQEGGRLARARFRHHLARLVVQEAIDHDPLKAGQASEGVGGAFANALNRGAAFESRAGRIEPGDQFDAQPGLLRALLDLDHHSKGGGGLRRGRLSGGRIIDDDVVFQPVGRAPAAREARLADGRHVAQTTPHHLAQKIGDRQADPAGLAGQILDRPGPLFQGQGVQVQHQQQAVALDRLGDVDRLPVAVVQGDLGADVVVRHDFVFPLRRVRSQRKAAGPTCEADGRSDRERSIGLTP